ACVGSDPYAVTCAEHEAAHGRCQRRKWFFDTLPSTNAIAACARTPVPHSASMNGAHIVLGEHACTLFSMGNAFAPFSMRTRDADDDYNLSARLGHGPVLGAGFSPCSHVVIQA